MYQVFLPGWEMYQGEKYQVFEIFDFLAGWTLKFSAFATPLLSFPYMRLHDWICMYCTLHFLCTRFFIVPGFLLPGFLSFLKCTRFQSTRYFKKVSGLRYQVGESTRLKVPRPCTFLQNLVKKKPMQKCKFT